METRKGRAQMPIKHVTEKLSKKFKAMCRNAYVACNNTYIHGLSYTLQTAWHGGNSYSSTLAGKDLAVIELGRNGQLLVVIPFEKFLELAQQSEPFAPKVQQSLNLILNEAQDKL
jgi:hypothetical protein